MESRKINIALIGNPNSGKSSLFNCLTGLNQKVGNFPGVTVDKRTGFSRIDDYLDADILDLPGTYSLYPRRADEWVTYKVLMDDAGLPKPEIVVLVVDAANLKRNLLYCSQIIDLKIPMVLALTMADLAKKKGTAIDVNMLQRELGIPVVVINPRKNKGIGELKKTIVGVYAQKSKVLHNEFIEVGDLATNSIVQLKGVLNEPNHYKAIHILTHHKELSYDAETQNKIESVEINSGFNKTKVQAEEIVRRYHKINQIIKKSISEKDPIKQTIFTEQIDDVLLHRFWGYFILMGVLFFLFQSIFIVAQYPMDWIELGFGRMSGYLNAVLPDNAISGLLINGVLAGLSGILVFVPQIMILFGLITILEDTGYMARISFLTDRLMRKVGLNGKSVMPMISGFACAVPAIMSARSIENRKERLLTILVTPLMSCSARLPVYTILIALVIPETLLFGFISVQGLVMMGLYLIGLVAALIVAMVFKWFIKIKEKSFFILELPHYRAPRWKTVGTTMVEKAKIFVSEAGKVIMVISLILWGLSSYGPGNRIEEVRQKYASLSVITPEQNGLEKKKKAEILENSYAGIMGQMIEPAIRPLGFDWKIGIALITSFAAREVFVGTMATLYSVEDDGNPDDMLLRQKMRKATFSNGTPVYTLGTGLSLMIFYVFAMQCMSTLAIVKRETQTWKWPVIQFIYMTALAYVGSLIIYQIFS